MNSGGSVAGKSPAKFAGFSMRPGQQVPDGPAWMPPLFPVNLFFQIKEHAAMSRAHKALAILVVSTLGLWGCAKGPGSTSEERIKGLEGKVSRLEGDLKVAETTRDQLHKQLPAAEEQVVKLQHDRNDIEKTLTARTSERDNVQTQFEQFRKSLRELIGQADA